MESTHTSAKQYCKKCKEPLPLTQPTFVKCQRCQDIGAAFTHKKREWEKGDEQSEPKKCAIMANISLSPDGSDDSSDANMHPLRDSEPQIVS